MKQALDNLTDGIRVVLIAISIVIVYRGCDNRDLMTGSRVDQTEQTP